MSKRDNYALNDFHNNELICQNDAYLQLHRFLINHETCGITPTTGSNI